MNRAAILSLGLLAGCQAEATPTPAPSHASGLLPVRVIDGDTFELDGEVIRIANIDAPERAPRAKCQAEAALAEVATARLAEGLGVDDGQTHTILPPIQREGRDRYGRTLALVRLASGQDAGEVLVGDGVAVRWTGRAAAWCEEVTQ